MTQQVLTTSNGVEATKAGPEKASALKLFGLVELDAAGTVLYWRIEPGASPNDGEAPDYTGLNFYREVATFRNVAEFREQLERFRRGSQPALSFDFNCEYEDGPVSARVLLARIREPSRANETKSILVHIKRAQ